MSRFCNTVLQNLIFNAEGGGGVPQKGISYDEGGRGLDNNVDIVDRLVDCVVKLLNVYK